MVVDRRRRPQTRVTKPTQSHNTQIFRACENVGSDRGHLERFLERWVRDACMHGLYAYMYMYVGFIHILIDHKHAHAYSSNHKHINPAASKPGRSPWRSSSPTSPPPSARSPRATARPKVGKKGGSVFGI